MYLSPGKFSIQRGSKKTKAKALSFLVSASVLTSFVFLSVYSLIPLISGASGGSMYSPGETLEPTCLPGDLSCTVTQLWNLTGSDGFFGLSGNLGIGTSTPSTKLAVVGNGYFSGSIFASNVSGTNTGDESSSTIRTKLGQASSTSDGYLTTSDWTTFSSKQDNITSSSTDAYYRGDKAWSSLSSDVLPIARNSISSGHPSFSYATTTGILSLSSGYSIPTSASTTDWTTAYNTILASSSNWNSAYTWGNHALAGYLTSESDPLFISASSSLARLTGAIFSGSISSTNFTGTSSGTNTGDLTNTTVGLTLLGQGLSLTPGYIIPSVASTTVWEATTNYILTSSVSAPLYNVGNNISIYRASSTASGYLTAVDWNTFNNKLSTTSAGAIGLGNVENTALSTWSGSSNITNIGSLTDDLNVLSAGVSGFAGALSVSSTTGTSSFAGNVSVGGNLCLGGVCNNTWPGTGLGDINVPAGYTYRYNNAIIANASTTKFNYFFGGSGNLNITGSYNTAEGANALASTTSGARNTVQGSYSMFSNTTGSSNVAQGVATLYTNTSGNYNTAHGDSTLYFNATGNNNSAHGYSALFNNDTGSNNSAQGFFALSSNTTGSYNTADGVRSLNSNTTGNNNSSLGANALYSLTSGSNNLALGFDAGHYQANGSTFLTTASSSIYIGANSRGFNNSDNNTIVIGANAIGVGANSVVLGDDNILTTALKGNVGVGTTTPGSKLTVSGSGYFSDILNIASTTGTSVFSGNLSLLGGLSDSASSLGTLGYVLQSTGTSTRWVATSTLGISGGVSSQWTSSSSDIYYTTGNVGIGNSNPAEKLSVTGDISLSGSLKSTNGGTYNMYTYDWNMDNFAFGAGAMASSTGTDGIALGQDVLRNDNGYSNIGIGYQNLYSNTNGWNNIALGGFRNLYNNTTGYDNIAIGVKALRDNVDGAVNYAMGNSALLSNVSGTYNMALGDSSLGYSEGSNNIAVGHGSLAAINTGNSNTALGLNAGWNIISGSNNLFLGHEAGLNTVSGSNNIIIGDNANTASTTGSNQLSIGNWVYGNNGNISIGTTTSDSKLTIAGNTYISDILNVASTTGTSVISGNLSVLGNITASNMAMLSIASSGMVSVAPNDPLKFLRGDATWATIPYAQYIDQTNVRMYFKFDGSNLLLDSSGKGTVLNNSGALPDPSGKFNGAISISNWNSVITTNNASSLQLGSSDFTLQFWVKASNHSFALSDNGNSVYQFVYNNTANILTPAGTVPVPNIPRNVWTHVAIVRTGANLSLYYNGGTAVFSANIGTDSYADNGVWQLHPGYWGTQDGALVDDLSLVIGQSLIIPVGGPSAPGSSSTDGLMSYTDKNSLDSLNSILTPASSNLGIGTTTPFAKLTVSGNAHISDILTVASSTGTSTFAGALSASALCLNSDCRTSWPTGGVVGGGSSFWATTTNETDISYLGGNVGIGTSTPAYKLVVDGDLNLLSTSSYRINGVSIFSASTTKNNYFLAGAGNLNNTGSFNVAEGFGAMASTAVVSTGSYNTAQGAYVLYNNTTGQYNAAQGAYVLFRNTTGQYNSAQGPFAMMNNISGTFNVAQGYDALADNTTGSFNSGQGGQALERNTTGSYNTAQGYFSMTKNLTGSNNVAVGYLAGSYLANGSTYLSSSSNSTFIGANTRALSDSSINSIVIGYGAIGLGSDTVVIGNTNIQTTALRGNVGIGTTTPGSKLTVVGDINLASTTTAYKYNGVNLAFGSTTANNYFFGNAGNFSMTGTGNVGVGNQSLATITSGGSNSALGYQALYLNQSGTNNSALGYQALRANTGSNNTAQGASALLINTSGTSSVAVGFQSLYANTTGSANVALGYNTLLNNITGSNNVAIGTNAKGLNSSDSNSIIIGSDAVGLGSNSVVLGSTSIQTTALRGNVGIGTTTPITKLEIPGSIFNSSAKFGSYEIQSFGLNNNWSADNLYYDSAAPGFKYRVNGFGTFSRFLNGGLEIVTAPSGLAGAIATTTSVFNILNNGSVGIGTSSPDAKLAIVSTPGTSIGDLVASFTSNDTWQSGFSVSNTSSNKSWQFMVGGSANGSSGVDVGNFGFHNGNTSHFPLILDNANNNVYLVKDGGNVGIGTTSPKYLLDVYSATTTSGATIARFSSAAGTTCAFNSGGITCTSDLNLKKNVGPLSYDLDSLLKLKPVSYNWKAENDSSTTSLGFIAQEVNEVLPQLVTSDAGTLSLNTIGMIPVVVKSVQTVGNSLNAIFGTSTIMAFSSTSTVDISDLSVTETFTLLVGKALDKIFAAGKTFANLVAEKFTVGSASQPAGITMFDEDTKQPYCMKIKSGVVVTMTGECGSSNAQIINQSGSNNGGGSNDQSQSLPPVEDGTSTPEIVASSTPAFEPQATSTPPVVSDPEQLPVATSSEPVIDPVPVADPVPDPVQSPVDAPSVE